MVIKLSKLAEQDLDDIYDYSLKQFGRQQAREYIEAFRPVFTRLADNPNIGSNAYGMKKFPCGKHIVFYQVRLERMFIVRILHQRMLPERHLFIDYNE